MLKADCLSAGWKLQGLDENDEQNAETIQRMYIQLMVIRVLLYVASLMIISILLRCLFLSTFLRRSSLELFVAGKLLDQNENPCGLDAVQKFTPSWQALCMLQPTFYFWKCALTPTRF